MMNQSSRTDPSDTDSLLDQREPSPTKSTTLWALVGAGCLFAVAATVTLWPASNPSPRVMPASSVSRGVVDNSGVSLVKPIDPVAADKLRWAPEGDVDLPQFTPEEEPNVETLHEYVPPSVPKMRIRMSLRELVKDRVKRDNLLRAWVRIKALDVDNPNSFWNIAGFHGEPFLYKGNDPTDPEKPDTWGGWCQHGNVLFLPWHRAYLLRLEHALQAVSPGVDITLPYWDQTSEASLKHGIPYILTRLVVKLDGKFIPNPLRSFTLPMAIAEEEADMYYSKPEGYKSVRYPFSGIKSPAEGKLRAEQHNRVIMKFIEKHDELTDIVLLNRNVVEWLNNGQKNTNQPGRDAAYNSLLYSYSESMKTPTFTAFSNMNSAGGVFERSVEWGHNFLHCAVGGFESVHMEWTRFPDLSLGLLAGANGDMGENETAGFDPIFFFHHANVDRLFWAWQKKHNQKKQLKVDPSCPSPAPGEKPVPCGARVNMAQGPAPYQRLDQPLDMDTPLPPFQKPNGVIVTGNDLVDIRNQLHYDYTIGSLDDSNTPTKLSAIDKDIDEIKVTNLNVDKISDVAKVLGGSIRLRGAAGVSVAAQEGSGRILEKKVVDTTNANFDSVPEGSYYDGVHTESHGTTRMASIVGEVYEGKEMVVLEGIDRDWVQGSFVIRAWYTQEDGTLCKKDESSFIGQHAVLDHWRHKCSGDCANKRLTKVIFDLSGTQMRRERKPEDIHFELMYKDPVQGKTVTTKIIPSNGAAGVVSNGQKQAGPSCEVRYKSVFQKV